MTLLLTLDDGSVQRKLAEAVEFARAAVLEDAPEEQLGAHVGVTREDAVTASHLFEAQVPGYGGWRWSVTVAAAGEDEPVTVSEVVLVPGPSALVAPAWVPWERRVRAGDLGVGDIFPAAENDPRLVPAYLQSDDPAVEEVSREAGLGRVHALSRFGRTEAAARWHAGEFGPRSDMARSAPDVCGTCGFFVPLAGSLRGVFGVCGNDIAPADGHVVDVEYGCGAHSEVEVEVTSSVPVAELVYDDSLLDFTPAPAPAPSPEVVETAAAEPATGIAESDVSPAEVEPETAQAESPEAPSDAAVAETAASEAAVSAVAEPVEAAEGVAEPVTAGEVAEPREAAEAPEPAEPVVTDAVAEPGEAAEVSEPAEPVVTDAVTAPVVAEVPGPVAAEAAGLAGAVGESADGVAEPVEVAGEVAEPVAAAEAPELAAPVVTDAVAESGEAAGAPEPAEPVVSEGVAEAAVAAEVEPAASEAPVVTDAVAEPVVAEVPEPAEAEPTQAEVTDATELRAEAHEAVAEAEADEIPVAAESDAAEVDPVPAEAADLAAEPVSAGGEASFPGEAAEPAPAESAETAAPEAAEPVEVTEAQDVAEVTEAVAEAPGDSGGEPQDSEVPPAVLTDNVVTEASPADEAQAQVDNAPER
ncbi:DUF3027 domain-containing protein [Amycolatopsis sp. DG1A-15b]|uniref:DUF3027 domain-containing protein n=1 Tax=Amycolatopsis sp. DG1A-15b TaxID=3052846 RepID=UPI00255BAD3E|nr:DUF3027 domain-containing protein [Amycolatopsis sp. DG1A-15b]WIX93563.1 DUF3027 domain-containing protein [Amycolatopsis sp. DG1A-15b]